MISGRSVAAVLAGAGTLFALLILCWQIQVNIPPPAEMPGPFFIILGTLLTAVVSQLPGGFVTGFLAPSRPVVHGLVMAGIAALLLAAGLARRGAAPFPWGFGLGVLQLPGILLGVWIARRRREGQASAGAS